MICHMGYIQPTLLKWAASDGHFITSSRAWIVRLVGVVWLGLGVSSAKSPAEAIGAFIGAGLVALAILVVAYRVLSTTDVDVETTTTATDEPENCPDCNLNLAMGVEECQRCGWTPSE